MKIVNKDIYYPFWILKQKAYKYLFIIINIYQVIKISIEDLYCKGKLLVLTWHFKEELDRLKKPIEFVLDVLEKGEPILVSKTQNKYNLFYPFWKRLLCLSYVENDDNVSIHIKPLTKMVNSK